MIAGNLAPGASQIAVIGYPIPQLAIASVGIIPAPLIELALNAEEPSLISSFIRVHGCFLRLHSLSVSLPAFALYTAFPCADYYAGSAPCFDLRRSPRLARCPTSSDRARFPCSSFRPLSLRRRALPLAMQGDGFKELPVAGLERSSPLVRKFQPNHFGSHLLPAPFSRYGSVVAITTEASDARFVVSP